MSLTASQRAGLTSARDLLVNGSAYETPLSEDVLQRISPVLESIGVSFSFKSNYEVARDVPVSFLIGLLWACGIGKWTTEQTETIFGLLNVLTVSTAAETPFPPDVIQVLAPISEATGFKTIGGLYEALRDAPVSTMLNWSLHIGA